MRQMSRRERIQAAINRQPVDRVPYAVWRHFPVVDRSPAGLAQATLRFHDHSRSPRAAATPSRPGAAWRRRRCSPTATAPARRAP